MSYRDMGCGEPRAADDERTLTLSGWVGRRRDHGGLIFIDLRDRSGAVQLVIDPERAPDAHAIAHRLRLEEVVRVRGVLVLAQPGDAQPGARDGRRRALGVRDRAARAGRGAALPARRRERRRDAAHPPPLPRPAPPAMLRIQKIRVDVTRIMRRYLEDRGFWELETPMLTQLHARGRARLPRAGTAPPGSFYALPQSPQLFKQLLMIAGYDRYYQIARCFRDEAQRADRQLEFTQLDIEMSFVEREDVLTLSRGCTPRSGSRSPASSCELPFPRLLVRRGDAPLRVGQAGPALRARDRRHQARPCAPRSSASSARPSRRAASCAALRSRRGRVARKDIDELQAFAKEWGGKGLACT